MILLANNIEMKANIFASFEFLKIEETKSFYIQSLMLTGDEDYVVNNFFNEDIIKAIGTHTLSVMLQKKCYIQSHLKLNNGEIEINNPDEAYTNIKQMVLDIVKFLTFLWFSKDCNCNLIELVSYFPESKTSIRLHGVNFFTSADCIAKETYFSLEELQYSMDMLMKYESLSKMDEPTNNNQANNKIPFESYNNSTRIDRAMNFLFTARKEFFLPLKIAMYIPIFESLFSSGNSELSHKVSERCAVYLGGSKENKIEVYKLLKTTYDFRSALLHGSKLNMKSSGKNHNLPEIQVDIAREIDDLTRKVMTKVISQDSNIFLENDIDTYFNNLIFS